MRLKDDIDYILTMPEFEPVIKVVEPSVPDVKPRPIKEFDFEKMPPNILAFDEYGQPFLPRGIVKIDNDVYDAREFNFDDVEEFLKGKKIEIEPNRTVRIPPKKIKWFLLLPTPEQVRGEKE